MNNAEFASIYRLTATNFRMSAAVLSRDFEQKGEAVAGNRRAIPFYYLVSHSIELLLKCALLKRGQTPEDLKKYPIGHGLEILLHKLIELGVPVSQNASRLILALSPQHAVQHCDTLHYLMMAKRYLLLNLLNCLISWTSCYCSDA